MLAHGSSIFYRVSYLIAMFHSEVIYKILLIKRNKAELTKDKVVIY